MSGETAAVTPRRLAYVLLVIGLVASLFVGVRRERREAAARTVEIVMDDGDFSALTHSFGFDEPPFLLALHQAGLSSLAVAEELGSTVGTTAHDAVYAGGALLDQARIASLDDPLFIGLDRAHAVRSDEVYLIAYDAPTARRFAAQLPLKFPPPNVRVLRAQLPAVWAIRTESDYFALVALGLPDDRLALARGAGLALVPRLQNDENFSPAAIRAVVADAAQGGAAKTAVFFGIRNEVLGFPNHIDAAAAALRANHLDFGTIEFYDPKQEQAGNRDLARKLPDRIVRVLAISKTEQDKLRADEIVARYLLGVRERNVRVVYLRPLLHRWGNRSLEQSNVDLVRSIAQGVRAAGMQIGPASPFRPLDSSPLVIALASLALPAIVLLICAELGLASWPLTAALVLADLLLVGAGYALHHALLARQLLAFGAGLAFPSAGFLALGWAFRGEPGPVRSTNPYLRGLAALVIATVVTLGGALVVVGLLSTSLTMTEIDRFAGVKYVLVLPALIALVLYFATDRFGAKIDAKSAAQAPVSVLQLLVGLVLLAAAFVLVVRSGNQSDIAPSSLELALRTHLTTLLQVRPRFKEFVTGFPALMLVPALLPIDRRRWGWLFALAIGVGLADLIDTFSHLHTALAVSAERVVNGAVLGALIGAVAIAAYRRLRPH